MAINYNAVIGCMYKSKTGEIFKVEKYLGDDKHKYNIRFVVNGKVKTATYNDIKNNKVSFSFRKPIIKSAKKKIKKKPTIPITKNVINSGVGVFSIDLASKVSGYTVFSGASYIKSGIISKMDKDKFIRINKVVDEIIFRIKEHDIEYVIIEDIYMDTGKSSVLMYKALANLQGVLVCRLLKEGYKYELVMAQSWKSHFFKTRYSRAEGKKKSIEYVKSITGLDLTEDEAESFLIGLYFLKINS